MNGGNGSTRDCGWRREVLDPRRRTGLILCGMGGPDGPESVEPFLRNLFRDPMIFPVPRLLAPLLGALIARRRAPAVRARYALISDTCTSPQLETTRRQAAALAGRLSAVGRLTIAGTAMRYWRPFPDQTVAQLLERGAEQFLVVPMYPQYSCATNGSTLQFVQQSLDRLAPAAPVHILPEWHLQEGFLEALAGGAAEGLLPLAAVSDAPERCALLYAAHSLPQRFSDRGDPYLERTRQTVAAVHERLKRKLIAADRGDWLAAISGGREPHLAFQSKVGPIAWLGPELTAEVERLAATGIRRLLVQPVSFTCEHIETLHELDIELAADARRLGLVEFRRGAALNLDAGWLDSFAAQLAAEAFDKVGSHV